VEISLNAVLRKIKWMVIPYLLILVICLVIKLTFSRPEIYFAVNRLYNPAADFLAPFVTDLGNGWFAIILAAIFTLFSYRKALLIAVSYAVTSLIAQVIKYSFDLPRPKLYFGDQIKDAHFVKGVYILSFDSFPSGHTITAFSLAVLFTYWCRNRAFGILFLFIAVCVGYSRMYLSEHFFEDVVAGSVIGLILTIFCIYWLDNRKFIQKPAWQKGLLK
jgi:membrane-associated phospholipid phosphatase